MSAAAKLKAVAGSTFEAGVEAALAVRRKLFPPDVPTYGDGRDDRWTARLYLAESLRVAGLPGGPVKPEHLRSVAAGLARDDDPLSHAMVDRLRGNARRIIRALRVDQGAALTPPLTGIQTVLGGESGDYSQLLFECSMFKTTPREIVALEVLLATEETPEVFGRVDRMPDEQAALEREFDEVCARIAWSLDDCRWELIDERNGIGQLKFAWHGSVTPINVYPLADAGKRLVGWVAAQKD